LKREIVQYIWLIYPTHLPALPAREALVNKRSLSGTFAHHAGSASLGSGLKFIVSDFLSHVRARAAAAWRVILEWERRRRSRGMLRSLSLREIRDFSPDLAAAEREARKPFWRA
jgi:uncharacterized protein YjiS (DUF1127 family)